MSRGHHLVGQMVMLLCVCLRRKNIPDPLLPLKRQKQERIERKAGNERQRYMRRYYIHDASTWRAEKKKDVETSTRSGYGPTGVDNLSQEGVAKRYVCQDVSTKRT